MPDLIAFLDEILLALFAIILSNIKKKKKTGTQFHHH